MWPMRWMMHQKRGLRMWILSMLAASPKNGVEIIHEIEGLTRGWWRPSPGSVYPLLDQLTQEGLVAKQPDGRYSLTSKAEDEMEWPFAPGGRRARNVPEMLTEIASYIAYFEELSGPERKRLRDEAPKLQELADRLSKLSGP